MAVRLSYRLRVIGLTIWPYLIQCYADLRISIALARSTLRDEEFIAQLRIRYWLSSYSKYTIYHLKHCLCFCVQKIQHLGMCLEINTAPGFALCCIYLSTPPLCCNFLTNSRQCFKHMLKTLLRVMYGKYSMRGEVEWQIQHEVKPSAVFARDPTPSTVFSVHHE